MCHWLVPVTRGRSLAPHSDKDAVQGWRAAGSRAETPGGTCGRGRFRRDANDPARNVNRGGC